MMKQFLASLAGLIVGAAIVFAVVASSKNAPQAMLFGASSGSNILGQEQVGFNSTVFQNGTDWVPIAADASATIWTLAGQPIPDGGIINIAALVNTKWAGDAATCAATDAGSCNAVWQIQMLGAQLAGNQFVTPHGITTSVVVSQDVGSLVLGATTNVIYIDGGFVGISSYCPVPCVSAVLPDGVTRN